MLRLLAFETLGHDLAPCREQALVLREELGDAGLVRDSSLLQ